MQSTVNLTSFQQQQTRTTASTKKNINHKYFSRIFYCIQHIMNPNFTKKLHFNPTTKLCRIHNA
ncbi:hypothetical protein HanPSC8_Chr11g0485481 [Helianthus annuus]|nr:hypothetical protein HanPSC8_Chr11g0485481 [Helianthus annuus]